MASAATAPIRNAAYSGARFEEWHGKHKRLPFSPTWNPLLIEWMMDDCETAEARSLAWIILRAAGNFSDRPVDENGNSLGRTDCARETGLASQRVSEAFAALKTRGYVAFDGRELILRDDPAAGDRSGPDPKTGRGQFREFKTQYLEQNPLLAQMRSELKSRLKSIDYQILKAYKEDEFSRTSRENEAAEASPVFPDIPGNIQTDESLNFPDSPGNNPGQVGKQSRTGREKTGGILIETVEPENYKKEAASAAAGTPADYVGVVNQRAGQNGSPPPPVTSVIKFDPPDGWGPCRQRLRNMDKTAPPKQVAQLIEECRKARDGLTPDVLLQVLSSPWPFEGIRSAVAYFITHLPAMLADDEWLHAFLQNPESQRFNRDADEIQKVAEWLKKKRGGI